MRSRIKSRQSVGLWWGLQHLLPPRCLVNVHWPPFFCFSADLSYNYMLICYSEELEKDISSKETFPFALLILWYERMFYYTFVTDYNPNAANSERFSKNICFSCWLKSKCLIQVLNSELLVSIHQNVDFTIKHKLLAVEAETKAETNLAF